MSKAALLVGAFALLFASLAQASAQKVLRVTSSKEARTCVAIAADLVAGLDRYSVRREPNFKIAPGVETEVIVVSGMTLEAPPATEQVILVGAGAECGVHRIDSPEMFYGLIARLEIGEGRFTLTGQGLGCPPPNRVKANLRATFAFSDVALEVTSVRLSRIRTATCK